MFCFLLWRIACVPHAAKKTCRVVRANLPLPGQGFLLVVNLGGGVLSEIVCPVSAGWGKFAVQEGMRLIYLFHTRFVTVPALLILLNKRVCENSGGD